MPINDPYDASRAPRASTVSVEEMAARLRARMAPWIEYGELSGMSDKRIQALARSALSALPASEAPQPHGIAAAPEGTEACVYCGNENIGVEIRDDKYPGMCGFSVVCGSAFCGARGPVRPAQMDAVDEWNRAYRWVHPPQPSRAAQPFGKYDMRPASPDPQYVAQPSRAAQPAPASTPDEGEVERWAKELHKAVANDFVLAFWDPMPIESEVWTVLAKAALSLSSSRTPRMDVYAAAEHMQRLGWGMADITPMIRDLRAALKSQGVECVGEKESADA